MHSTRVGSRAPRSTRSEEHTSELQSRENIVCRLLLEKKKMTNVFLLMRYATLNTGRETRIEGVICIAIRLTYLATLIPYTLIIFIFIRQPLTTSKLFPYTTLFR